MNLSQYRSCPLHTQAYLQLLAAAIRRGQRASFEVRGSCMWPTLKPGDRIQVGPLRRTPRLGDVLVCYCGERAVAHRVVVCLREDWVRCRGDAALELDAPLRASEALGIVESVSRAGNSLPLPASAALSSRLVAPLRAAASWLRAQEPLW